MIISFVNNKGGVLKTTMATNVAAAITKIKPNAKVVVVDLDGQGNIAVTFGQHPEKLKHTLIDVFRGKKEIKDCIVNIYENFDILPCNFELSFVDIDIATANERKRKGLSTSGLYTATDVKNVIATLNKQYDYVILDTPPTMATVVSICLSISNLVVIPFEPDQYSLVGLMRIINTISDFKKKKNKSKALVIPTKINQRVKLHVDVVNLIKQKLKEFDDVKVSTNYVSLTTKPAASVGYEMLPIVLSSSKSKYSEEYTKIAKEVTNILDEISKK